MKENFPRPIERKNFPKQRTRKKNFLRPIIRKNLPRPTIR